MQSHASRRTGTTNSESEFEFGSESPAHSAQARGHSESSSSWRWQDQSMPTTSMDERRVAMEAAAFVVTVIAVSAFAAYL